jgi:hypothetical protein
MNRLLPALSSWLLAAAALGFSGTAGLAADAPPAQRISFENDIMPVLSKAGCNMGVCHGNKNGKGGFKLSLRGEDSRADFATLTRELNGRRANLVDPERSLLLLKPTMEVPHEGGRRFKPGSPEYAILRGWMAQGMPADEAGSPTLRQLDVSPRDVVLAEPADSVQIRATAEFSDGTRRDVSGLAVYDLSNQLAEVSHDGLVERRGMGETTVVVRFLNRQVPVNVAFIPARDDFNWTGPLPANVVDEHVFAKLKRLRINPSPPADDTAFVRRAYLDLLGILPTAEEARRFTADPNSNKRSLLIDELLERPEYADFWALKWSDLLRNEEKTLDWKGVQNLHEWIRVSVSTNKPLDQFVRELVGSRGSTYSVPAANYYRAMRTPIMRAESTAQLFLGVRLQCAKCHSHPFDRWTQTDYYGWAGLFARVDYRVLENNRRDRNDSHEFDGEQIVYMKRKGEVEDPRTGRPAPPRFLGAEDGTLAPDADRLLALADWLTSADNAVFVQTQANRIWYHLLGRGIVEPIDDFRATNPPSNAPLLEALSQEFANSQFDVKHLIRLIMNSRTYQFSAATNETNRDDEANFSHASVQRLSAEQYLDALSQVTGRSATFNAYPEGIRAGELSGVRATRERDRRSSSGDQFLRLFGKPQRLQSCECERTNEPTLAQTFQLVSGALINEMLAADGNRLAALLSRGDSDGELVDEIYWTALSRAPSAEERRIAANHLAAGTNRRAALEDLVWGLLNSNEFLLRR